VADEVASPQAKFNEEAQRSVEGSEKHSVGSTTRRKGENFVLTQFERDRSVPERFSIHGNIAAAYPTLMSNDDRMKN